MIGKKQFVYLFFLCLVCFCSAGYCNDVALMDAFDTADWACKRIGVSYNTMAREVAIGKVGFTPNWGSAKIELGTIDVSDAQENNLSFEITQVSGSFGITLRYGGPGQYDTHFIEIQKSTDMAGSHKYNISEALRNASLSGKQQIEIEFTVMDDEGEQPGTAEVILKNLTFGYDDSFAVTPSDSFKH